MKRILRRTFVIIITFVLVFAISIPCFADDSKKSPAGFNSWSTNDKIAYLSVCASDIISSVTGTISGDASSMNKLLLDLYANQPEAGVTNFYEYLANGLSFDDDTETWTLSDDLVDFCNQLIVEYNDKVTMIYRYPVRPDQLDAEWFSSKSGYDALVAAISDHPELYFYVAGTTSSHNIIDFYVFSSDELACVNSNEDLIYANCALYNSDWNQDFNVYHCRMVDGATSFQCVGANPSNIKSFDTFDELLACDWNYDTSVASVTLMRSDNIKWDITQAKWLVTAKPGALNCYKSANDMKKDLADQVIGTYTPEYTGKASNTVTQNYVNNVVNNYYGGGSSGDDSGGSPGSGSDDSGGGSGILDGIGKVFGAIGKVFDTIFGFVLDIISKIVDNITKIIDMFVDTLKKLIDLIPSGFNDFLAALFPYIPDEWITIINAILLTSALGVAISIFRK